MPNIFSGGKNGLEPRSKGDGEESRGVPSLERLPRNVCRAFSWSSWRGSTGSKLVGSTFAFHDRSGVLLTSRLAKGSWGLEGSSARGGSSIVSRTFPATSPSFFAFAVSFARRSDLDARIACRLAAALSFASDILFPSVVTCLVDPWVSNSAPALTRCCPKLNLATTLS